MVVGDPAAAQLAVADRTDPATGVVRPASARPEQPAPDQLAPDQFTPEQFASVLDGARRGEGWAMEAIYRRLHPAVLAFCAARVPDEAEDLASEVFIAVARGVARFEGDAGAFRSWVFAIAYRLVGSRWRQARRRAEPAGDLGELAAFGPVSGGPHADADAEAEAMAGLETGAALRLIAQLPRPRRRWWPCAWSVTCRWSRWRPSWGAGRGR
ncbi:MAG TPA: RNA polymerase sigma factor [Acidimicrobiales bacterium]|nr:RNA polymerase sigma factor [Acidimicrobiales bacterium]